MYEITEYTKKKAKELNVLVSPSKRKHKKLDVFDSKGTYITSVGDSRYSDYPTYVKTMGKGYADERRKLYIQRHINDTGKAGYYALKLLW